MLTQGLLAVLAVAVLVTGCSSAGTSTPTPTQSSTQSSRQPSTSSATPNWTVAQSGGALDGWLDGVDCTTATSCVAVGNESAANGYTKALIETMNQGSWSAATAPGAPSSQGDFLFSVSCASAGNCVAVGYFLTVTHSGSGKSGTMLIETFANGNWSVTSTPSLGSSVVDSFLYGVSCTTPTTCTAAGNTDAGRPSTSQPLIVTLANGRWSASPGPNLGSQSGGLLAVTCTSPTACVAGGYRATAGSDMTLIETLNGATWSITPSTGSGGSNSGESSPSGLDGVWCATATSCVAVGQLTGPVPTVEILTNLQWSAATSPDPDSGDAASGLYGVSCSAATQCVAVGDLASTLGSAPDGAFGSPLGTLIETNSGGTWTIAASPSGLPPNSGLHAVSCVGHSCVAVGQSGQFTSSTPGTAQTLIIQTQ